MAFSVFSHPELAGDALAGFATRLLREPIPGSPQVGRDIAFVPTQTVHLLELAASDVRDPLLDFRAIVVVCHQLKVIVVLPFQNIDLLGNLQG